MLEIKDQELKSFRLSIIGYFLLAMFICLMNISIMKYLMINNYITISLNSVIVYYVCFYKWINYYYNLQMHRKGIAFLLQIKIF